MKNALLAGIVILLISACGPAITVSVPAATPESVVAVTESPVDIPTVVSTEPVAPEKFSQYIGLKYTRLPVDLSEGFSMLIHDTDGYGLSLVSDSENKMLWLNKMTQHDSSGTASWEVQDVLDLSRVESGLILPPDGCFLNGVADSEIFVAGRNGVTVLAWRANTTLNMFEVIPTDGIKCNSDKGIRL